MIQGREVEDTDQFHFNTDFSERLYRIKINAIQMKETVDENKKTNDQVLQDRQYQVDCPRMLPLLNTSGSPLQSHLYHRSPRGQAYTGSAHLSRQR